jgi:hypothetical protein
MFLFIKKKGIFALSLLLIGLAMAVAVVKADWQDPSGTPPASNQPRPLNVSSVMQEKTGGLILSNSTNGLIMRDQTPLMFGPPAGNRVGFRASTTAPTNNDIIWTLPITDGQNNYVLTTNGAGQLGWSNPIDLITVDPDWRYAPNGNAQNFTSIYSEKLTRVGSGGTMNHFSNAGDANHAGDLYVQNNLEVGGMVWAANPSGNAEIDIQSGANNHWGLYQDNTGGALRFWNTNDILVLTTNGRVGIGTNAPAQALDIVGGLKLTGLIYDGAGATGANGQILSSNGSNIKWIDPTWWTGANYIYSSQNTRVGSGGTPAHATGSGDLFVQNNLEVGGTAYLGGLNLTYLTPGSVIFEGPSGLAQNNANFFWDNANHRLGLGTNTPAQTLDINGNVGLTQSATDGSNGVVYLNGKRFIHSTGQSDAASTPYTGSTENSNTFIGSMAGSFFDPAYADYQNIVATENTAVGFYALNSNFDGYQNTAIGSGALYKNGSGTFNSGSLNVAVGSGSLFNNVNGNKLTAVGVGALYSDLADESTAVGYQAGYYNNSGIKNVFVGNLAGYRNTTGQQNTYLGYGAGYKNQTGAADVYLGYQAGLNNTGSNNLILGANAGGGATTNSGSNNIFLGVNAGFNETGNYKLYIDSTGNPIATSSSALIYGQFYSASTTPLLRFNTQVGIVPRGVTIVSGMTFPNKLLHLYQPAGDNAEIDIQSVSGANKHWAIFNDRTTNFLTFWNNAINDSNGESKDMLTLALNGPSTDKPSIGIGTGLNTPIGHVEIRSQIGDASNTLNLSSFVQSGLNSSTAGYNLGSNIITFTGGRYRVESDNNYEFRTGAAIWAGFGTTDGQFSPSDFRNSKIAIQTLNSSGNLIDTIVAQDNKVGIGGGIDRSKTLRVHGSTMSNEYWSDNNGGQQGASANGDAANYLCVGKPGALGSLQVLRLRFEDGLYICSCDGGTGQCPGNNCTCNNPP